MPFSDASLACLQEVANTLPEDPRCEACASGLLQRAQVDMAFWANGRLVMVRDVPALVCDACGEQYTEDEVAMQLDLMRGVDFRAAREVERREVPVYAFPGDGNGTG